MPCGEMHFCTKFFEFAANKIKNVKKRRFDVACGQIKSTLSKEVSPFSQKPRIYDPEEVVVVYCS